MPSSGSVQSAGGGATNNQVRRAQPRHATRPGTVPPSPGVPVRLRAILLALVIATVAAMNPATALSSSPSARQPATSATVLQMNLCLSGFADCYPGTAYPAVVDEAAEQVMTSDAEVVTLNEVCRGDAADMALRTGYRMRFTAVLVDAAPLRCVEPLDRGAFGLAILTKARIRTSDDQAFETHAGLEERRWLCITTVDAVSVCTAHLGTRDSREARHANDAECAELQRVLARYDKRGTTLFGGDVNRQRPCAPAAMWARSDTAGTQQAGIQHLYGSRFPREPATRIAVASHTDHDFLLAAGRAEWPWVAAS